MALSSADLTAIGAVVAQAVVAGLQATPKASKPAKATPKAKLTDAERAERKARAAEREAKREAREALPWYATRKAWAESKRDAGPADPATLSLRAKYFAVRCPVDADFRAGCVKMGAWSETASVAVVAPNVGRAKAPKRAPAASSSTVKPAFKTSEPAFVKLAVKCECDHDALTTYANTLIADKSIPANDVPDFKRMVADAHDYIDSVTIEE
jgi:hypothetical protein